MKIRTIISLTLVILYGFALLKPALPLFEYYVKMDVYLEQCINKDRPELHCNGQCILMQKLKALNPDTPEPTAPAPVKINLQDYPIGFIEIQDLEIPLPEKSSPGFKWFSGYIPGDYLPEVFHPPAGTA